MFAICDQLRRLSIAANAFQSLTGEVVGVTPFEVKLDRRAEWNQIFVPRGFAHGYVVLSETAEFAYKCDNFYSKAHEGGLIFNDPALKIDWEIDPAAAILSEKDAVLPLLCEHRK